MKFIVQDTFSIKKVLIFGGFGLCRFQHKVGMNSFPMRMNVISYGTNSFPWGMYSFRSKIPIVSQELRDPRAAEDQFLVTICIQLELQHKIQTLDEIPELSTHNLASLTY